MRFTKMHGAGNDYVYVNCFEEPVPEDPAHTARLIADRHFGVGGDGLVLICPSDKADARMRMFNADGSEAEMCGNAIRCVGKYLFDHGLCDKQRLQIETGRGILTLDLEVVDGLVERARVDMGEPILKSSDVPTTLAGDPPVNATLDLGDRQLTVTCVSMGNPHCITYVDKLSDEWVYQVGPRVEHAPQFPRRVNAEFIEILSPDEVRMRVWERGSGETLACGTGAAAVCVAGVLAGKTNRKIIVHLLGGDLELEWAEDNHVYKTGPATEVFSGEWTPAAERALR
ncbi:MAG: diaminopimelate epimerase [Pirellulales bacterium]|nr:diaminopimelate epimerase [Pirellulales bacterium]